MGAVRSGPSPRSRRTNSNTLIPLPRREQAATSCGGARSSAASNVPITQGGNTMNGFTKFTLTAITMLCLAVALPAIDAVAQQKQKVSYKTPPENTKYTQQHLMDVGDVPGHQVRIYEIHRTYPGNAPMINGVKLKEQWTRVMADY